MRVQVENWDMWRASDADDSSARHAGSIPAATRRRLNNYGRTAGGLAADKVDGRPLIVFASRYGDAARSVGILEEIAKGDEISPLHFSLSVHNAVCGILSIAWKLDEMQSVIAAGVDTFAMGVTECLSLLNAFPDKQVLLIYVDYPLPDVFAAFGEPVMQAEAFALLLSHNKGSDSAIDLEVSLNNQLATGQTDLLKGLEAVLEGAQDKVYLGTKSFGWEVSRYVA